MKKPGVGYETQADQNSEKEVIGIKTPVMKWGGSFRGCRRWGSRIPGVRLTKFPCLCGERNRVWAWIQLHLRFILKTFALPHIFV